MHISVPLGTHHLPVMGDFKRHDQDTRLSGAFSFRWLDSAVSCEPESHDHLAATMTILDTVILLH